jgi:hypothetical protein
MKKNARYLAYSLTVLFLVAFAYLCLTAKILEYKQLLGSPYFSLGIFTAGMLLLGYQEIRSRIRFFTWPRFWQKSPKR